MMLRIRKAMAQKEQGFTLIELLVVIIIIGILAAIAIPIFLNQRKKGVDASLKSDAKNTATAAESYITDNPTGGNFGATAAETVTNFNNNGFKASTGNKVSIKGSPANGYCIRVSNTGASEATGTKYYFYDSGNGGLQTTAAATSGSGLCSVATGFTDLN